MIELDEQRAWEIADGQLARIADLLEGLDDEQWRKPSLCEGWTVRDVGGHLLSRGGSLLKLLGMVVRSGGNLNRGIDRAARKVAGELSDAEIVERLRGMVGRRAANPVVGARDEMVEYLVHLLDIAVPLGIPVDPPADGLIAALERTVAGAGGLKSKVLGGVPLGEYRLVATDAEWSAGEPGAELVEAPLAELLLFATGRRVPETH